MAFQGSRRTLSEFWLKGSGTAIIFVQGFMVYRVSGSYLGSRQLETCFSKIDLRSFPQLAI